MSSAAGAVARWISPFLAVAAFAALCCSVDLVQVATAPAVRLADEANPLAGAPFYVNPTSAAMRAAQSANPPSPELTAIANTPQAYWIVPGSSAATVAKYTGDAQAAGAMPVLALYGIPHRDCGSFAAGGFATAADYKGWIDGIAADLGSSPAAVIVEPDALAMADCLSGDQRQERFDLIRYAVDTLTRNPAAAVYIDAGHLRWHSADEMAARLNQAGVDHARGFSLNTANFFTTDDEIGYGEAISGLTNGSHYVIDTSRNGAGPAPDSRSTGATPAAEHWASRPLRRQRARTPTPTCGSNVPANPTDHATAETRRRATSSISSPSTWPVTRPGSRGLARRPPPLTARLGSVVIGP
jgi:endoglucanase